MVTHSAILAWRIPWTVQGSQKIGRLSNFHFTSLPSEPSEKPQNTGVGSLSPSPGELSYPGIEPGSPALQVDSLPIELSGKPGKHIHFFFNCNVVSPCYSQTVYL